MRCQSPLLNEANVEIGLDRSLYVIKRLGKGKEGQANVHQHRKTRQVFVIKTVERSITSEVHAFNEADILMMLKGDERHPNIVRCFGAYINVPDFGQSRIFLEYCESNDLFRFRDTFAAAKRQVPEAMIWHHFAQLISALRFLHAPGKCGRPPIIHRDIQPRNILLKEGPAHFNPFPSVKLADFGLAGVSSGFGTVDDAIFCAGTSAYRPPERPFTTAAADVWAVGAIVHFLASGKPPIPDMEPFLVDGFNWAGYPQQKWWWEYIVNREPLRIDIMWELVPMYSNLEAEEAREYSPELNLWMMWALTDKIRFRPTADELLQGLEPIAEREVATFRESLASGTVRDIKTIFCNTSQDSALTLC